MFSVQNLQINRGTSTANAQGHFTAASHTYIDMTSTVGTIKAYFPPYLQQGVDQEFIHVNDLIYIFGSDATQCCQILSLNPFTVGVDLFSGASGLSIGAPIAAVDANGATITGEIFRLEIADATHPGIMTSAAQTFGGLKSFANAIDVDTISEFTGGHGTIINGNTVKSNQIMMTNNNIYWDTDILVGFTRLNFDMNDFLSYSKISNAYVFNIASTPVFQIDGTGIKADPGFDRLTAGLLKIGAVNATGLAIGQSALGVLAGGTNNLAVGTNTLAADTTGSFNTALGEQALASNTVANNNTAVGYRALTANTTGLENTAVGQNALAANTTANASTAVGFGALAANTASQNTAVGVQALFLNTTGVGNTGIGSGTLIANTTGGHNTGLGNQALQANTTASDSTAVGYNALFNSTGGSNTAVGSSALTANTTGSVNTAIGKGALAANTTANSNTAVGNNVLNAATTGSFNTAIGESAMQLNTTGHENVGIGYSALHDGTTFQANTACGYLALQHNTADQNTAFGHQSLLNNTTGSGNVGLGKSALINNITGSFNVAIGTLALGTAEASNNVAIGQAALVTHTSGDHNIAIGPSALHTDTTGTQNIVLGFQSSFNSTTAASNVVMGYQALFDATTGSSNTAIGDSALQNITTGSTNIAIGAGAGNSLVSNESNNIDIGNIGVAADSGVTRIGTAGTHTKAFMAGLLFSNTGIQFSFTPSDPNQSVLSTYVEDTLATTFTNNTLTTGTITCVIRKIGKLVTILVPAGSVASQVTPTSFVANTALAAKYRPTNTFFYTGVRVLAAGTNTAGMVQIDTAGVITIFFLPSGANYPTGSTIGWDTFSESYPTSS